MVTACECVQTGYILQYRTFLGNTTDIIIAKVLVAEMLTVATGQTRVLVFDAGRCASSS